MKLVFAAPCMLLLCLIQAAAAQEAKTHTLPPPKAQILTDLAGRTLSGVVTDADGALVPGARVTLAMAGSSQPFSTVTGTDGHFSFSGVAAGKFVLTVTADGMDGTSREGVLNPDESQELPPIALGAAAASIDVEVTPQSQQEIAEQQIHQEEKQRVFGLAPNFYVTYDWNAVPLTAKQKYKMAVRSIVDPATFLIVGGVAGIEQAENSFSGYHQGTLGYAKRYGAGFADASVGAMLGGAVLPVWFHQDPRYFYKGTGTVRSRILYALSTAVIARGDNGKWQPAYAGILGDYASGAISNLYYPAGNRGVGLAVANGSISIATTGLQNVVQEFLLRKISTGMKALSRPQP